uniref:Innexin n=1 Tax=Plectus sambesii TaxID=2011161 RepID=A0A914WNX4_9BILA
MRFSLHCCCCSCVVYGIRDIKAHAHCSSLRHGYNADEYRGDGKEKDSIKMDMLKGLMNAVTALPDGDSVDRLNYCYTTSLLIVFSVFVSGWTFVGTPIQCWFPAYYKGWWNEYALDYCYVQNTYFLPFTEIESENYFDIAKHMVPIPKNITHRDEKLIGYYQWVPFVLALEAILFYLPVVIWRGMYSASGVKVKAVCDTCAFKQNTAPEDRKKNIETVARFLTYTNEITEQLHGGVRTFMAGRYISTLYLFIKFIFAVNCVLQFFMLQAFLGLNHFWWGADVVIDLLGGREWPQTGNFPRVTMCDFEVRVLGNLHRHTVQCVLMINMFNEKIFLFLWWWFFVVSIFSVLSFFYWLFTSVTERAGDRIINNYLDQIDRDVAHSPRRKQLVHEFLRDRLKADGVFLLRLVSANAGDVVTCELIAALWRQYRKERGYDTTPRPSVPNVALARRNGNNYPTLPMPPPYSEDEQPLLRGNKEVLMTESNL